MEGGSLRRSASALWRSCGPDVLLAHASKPEVLLLEGTAAAAWRLLDEPRTAAALAEELGRAFGARAADVRTTLDPFLADLVGRGLVELQGVEDRFGG